MPLNNIVLFRCNDKLKKKLASVARELGISESAISRNSLALAILPPNEPSKMEELIASMKKEALNGLFKRGYAHSKEKST